MGNSKIQPINRNNMFYSERDFKMECDMVQGYIEEDLNQCVVLYEVDRKKTNTNSVYKETENVRYKAPREIPCIYEIKDSELKSYDGKTSNGVYSVSGNLVFYVLVSTLEKYHCDVKRGDYIGVQITSSKMSYFVVTDDGKVNNANTNYIGAYQTAWRTVQCAPTTLNEFDSL